MSLVADSSLEGSKDTSPEVSKPEISKDTPLQRYPKIFLQRYPNILLQRYPKILLRPEVSKDTSL